MLDVFYHKKFVKDLETIKKSYKPNALKTIVSNLDEALSYIKNQKSLPPSYRDHKLNRAYLGYRDCHILGDLVLIYQVDEVAGKVTLNRIGTHSALGL